MKTKLFSVIVFVIIMISGYYFVFLYTNSDPIDNEANNSTPVPDIIIPDICFGGHELLFELQADQNFYELKPGSVDPIFGKYWSGGADIGSEKWLSSEYVSVRIIETAAPLSSVIFLQERRDATDRPVEEKQVGPYIVAHTVVSAIDFDEKVQYQPVIGTHSVYSFSHDVYQVVLFGPETKSADIEKLIAGATFPETTSCYSVVE